MDYTTGSLSKHAYVIILVRAYNICTHRSWEHRQWVCTTFLTQKNSQIFLVLMTGFETQVIESWIWCSTNWATPSPPRHWWGGGLDDDCVCVREREGEGENVNSHCKINYTVCFVLFLQKQSHSFLRQAARLIFNFRRGKHFSGSEKKWTKFVPDPYLISLFSRRDS